MNMLEMIPDPRGFFKSVEKEKLSDTIKKTWWVILLLLFIYSIVQHFGVYEAGLEMRQAMGQRVLDIGLLNIPLTFIIMVIGFPLGVVIVAALIKLGLYILKTKSLFSQVSKVYMYTSVISYVLSIIPFLVLIFMPVGFWVKYIVLIALSIPIAIICCMVLSKGIAQYSKISAWKAFGAILLGALIVGVAILLVVLAIVLIVVGIFAAIAAT